MLPKMQFIWKFAGFDLEFPVRVGKNKGINIFPVIGTLKVPDF
jgi:hypothetical protein